MNERLTMLPKVTPIPKKRKIGRPFVTLHPNPILAAEGLSCTFPARFKKKLGETTKNGCILWIGSIDSNGYGQIGKGSKSSGLIKATRAAWLIENGAIPNGKSVLHNCPGGDNPLCVNVDHLWIGSQKQNMEDMAKKGRANGSFKTNPRRGELAQACKLTRDQVKWIKKSSETGVALARKFSVTPSCISLIRRGKNWFWL